MRSIKNDQEILHSESYGWPVNAAAIKLNRLMSKAMEPLYLMQGQVALMKTLSVDDNITQIKIGKVVSIISYAMSRQPGIL